MCRPNATIVAPETRGALDRNCISGTDRREDASEALTGL
jgi:hypothetical protein